MKIGFDNGHTLKGLGTGANGIVSETKINREVGKLIIKYLKEIGETVVDCTVDVSSNDLKDRVDIANRNKVDLFVSLHLNAGGGKGTETYVINGASSSTKSKAQKVNDAIVKLGFTNRGVKYSNFYVLRNTNAPAMLIELFFTDTKSDVDLYKKLGADKVARAIAEAITGKKIPTTSTSTGFKVGDRATVSKSATKYATGEDMADWVKGNTYTIKELKSDRALLDDIVSWVYLKDLTSKTPSFKEYKVKITTDVLNVRAGAGTNYKVTTTVKKDEVYTIIEEKNGWGKLKSGAGWISLDYAKKC